MTRLLTAGAFPVLMLGLVFLSGCVSQTPVSRQAIETPEDWRLSSKLGIRSPGGSANLRMVWVHEATVDTLSLTGMFGSMLARVNSDGKSARLTLGDGREFAGRNMDELILEHLGYPLPVDSLQYWIRGRADPHHPANLKENGFIQDGWHIEYLQSGESGPEKMRISRDGIRLKLAGMQWR